MCGSAPYRRPARRVAWAVAVALAMMALPGGVAVAAKDLKPGDQAPDFTLPGSDGKTYRLSEFQAKLVVVVAWFPKAFTGG